jgi:hypothetical protein
MPRVGFGPTIPASKRAKTVHVLDHSATATGFFLLYLMQIVVRSLFKVNFSFASEDVSNSRFTVVTRPCHSSGGQSSTSHFGGPGSRPITSHGICGGQSGTGAGCLRVLRLPLPILIPPIAPHSSSTIRSWYNRPVSGRRTKWTVSPHLKKLQLSQHSYLAQLIVLLPHKTHYSYFARRTVLRRRPQFFMRRHVLL